MVEVDGDFARSTYSMDYTTTAYHTVEHRNNMAYVKEHAPFKCTRSDAWLSPGYYFWDQDFERGEEWGIHVYKGKCIILECELCLPKMWDLVGSRFHQKELQKLEQGILEHFPSKKRLSVAQIIAYLRELNRGMKGVFEYDSVKAQDNPRPVKYVFLPALGKKEQIDLNPRIQICIFEKTKFNVLRTTVVHEQS